MSDYTVTNKPANGSWNVSKVLRDEFALIQEAVNSKSDKLARTSVSTTAMTIGLGPQSFVVEPDKDFGAGEVVFISSSVAPSVNNMYGVVSSYDIDTGAMDADITSFAGSGTISSWFVTVSSAAGTTLVSNTFTGHQNFARATVASHATTADIWNALGNQIDWTGTATTTAFPTAPQAGASRKLICAGACSFTSGANLIIEGFPSGNTLQCSANDIVEVEAITTAQFYLTFTKYTGKLGGSDTSSSAVDVTLTGLSGRLQVVAMTAAGKKVTLPAATTLQEGENVFVISNTGDYRFSVHLNGGTFLAYVSPGQTLAAHCSDASTSPGVWSVGGDGIDRVYSGNTAEVLNAVATTFISVAMLTSTKAICAYRNGSTTFLNAVVLNYGSASGTPLAINAEASVDVSIAAQTSAQATVVYKTSTGVTKGYVLDVSGNTITPGPVATVDATAGGTGTGLSALSSTQMVCVYQVAGSGTIRSRILDIAASAITPGAETVVDATASQGSFLSVQVLSATKIVVIFPNTSSVTQVKTMTISGSALTAAGSVLQVTAPGTDVNLPVVSARVSATRVLIAQSLDVTYGDLYLSLIDTTTTTPVTIGCALINTWRGDNSVYIGNLVKLSTGVFFLNWSSGTLKTDGMVIRVTSDDRIVLSEQSIKLDADSGASQFYAACATLDSTHIMQATRNSSGYLSAKTLEIAI